MPFIYEKGKEMSKSILVIDTPITCEMCYLYRQSNKGRYCAITKEYDNEFGCVQKNCPLKPMPKKYIKIVQIENGIVKNNEEIQFMRGWNTCIDELLGEE